jgi:uncharacterized protein involved in exopolysaccharide biosynthesis
MKEIKWYIFALAGALAILVMLAGYCRMPVLYLGMAHVQLAPAPEGGDPDEEAAFINSREFLKSVFEDLSASELKTLAAREVEPTADTKRRLLERFVKNTRARKVARGSLGHRGYMFISFIHTNPEFAAKMANRIVAVYVWMRQDAASVGPAFVPLHHIGRFRRFP